ncbi:MAG TPA: c-type cytochrome [Vicinamibacterales bacterium]
MKILLKIVGGILLLLLLVAGCGYAYMMLAFPKVSPAGAFKIEATPERLERGKYLAEHVSGCVACHSNRDWTKFSGPVKPDTIGRGGDAFDLGPAGIVYAKNITPAGIGGWTDGELLRAVTEGVSKDGTPLFPVMPYPHFGAMAEDDVHALLAYIRSLKAIDGTPKPRTLNFPLNFIVRTIPAPARFTPRPSPSDKVAYGKYMTNIALCSDCHTPIDDQGQPLPGMDFAGGLEILETGHRVRTANITPDAATGIGSWTEQQFIDKFKGFQKATDTVLADNERAQNTPMPMTMYAGMAPDDLSAIYAYLRTLKPVTNRVEKFPDAK